MHTHSVRVTLGEFGETAAGVSTEVEEFECVSDMLELADLWSATLALTRELWDLAAPDSAIRIYVDDSQVLDGFIDDRERILDKGSGSTLRIVGRDKGGRLVDESAELVTFFDAATLEELAERLVKPWFPTVSLSNARNRTLLRGRGRRLAKTAGEPLVKDRYSKRTGKLRRPERKVKPGESPADVLSTFLERAELLGWSSADGKEFIVGLPNYEQSPQFFFFAAGPESARWAESNVEAVSYLESVGDAYSEIRVVGTGRGDDTNYGPNVTKRTATVKSDRLKHRKRLIVPVDDIRGPADAQQRAEREMRIRDAKGKALTLTVAGFGQALGGADDAPPALYACDTMARWEDEEIGLVGDYLITRVVLRRSKQDGETAELMLVPKGTELVIR